MALNNKIIIYLILLAVVGLNFILFGFNSTHIMGDAGQYLQIADGLTGQNNSISLLYREQGYPIFLAAIFGLFGNNNLIAVAIAQMALLALTAFWVYKIFELLNLRRVGFWSAVVVSILPSYIYYSNLILTEILFTFLLATSFYLVLLIAMNSKGRGHYILLGIVFAFLGLTRAHMLLLPIFVIFLLLMLKKPARNLIICGLAFLVVITGWMGYMYTRTGEVAITRGRQELHLYVRSIRSTLSYKGQIQYLASWMQRSASGGSEDELVSKYDPWFLVRQYAELMERGRSSEELKKESIGRLLDNPGHYILGSGVEWVKLMFIEHLFPPVSSYYGRWVRASMYLFLYSLFLSGIIRFWYKKGNLSIRKAEPADIFIVISGLFVLYHWLVMSFFDLIPRYNTPYLAIYLIIGAAGLMYKKGFST